MSTPRSSPHLPVADRVTHVMRDVLLALVPGIVAGVAWFGPGLLATIAWCVAAAVLTEAVLLAARGQPIARRLGDLSAVVTGVLLALALPPGAPWWLPVLGGALAIALGKQVFGGIGHNPFNPAMVGYVVLLVSFPAQLASWPPPGAWWQPPADAVSAATALDGLRTALAEGRTVADTADAAWRGMIGGRGQEWIALAYLLGGLWLWRRRRIDWRIPLGVLAGVATLALPFWLADDTRYPDPLFHLFAGATMLGAFFIATDPVSAATTPLGRLLFGFGIGVLTWVIRSHGSYPDAIAFAVLLMNIAAPTIDRHTRPRIFGQRARRP